MDDTDDTDQMDRMSGDAAERLLEKLRRFIREDLDDGERAAMAVLVAPAVARANGTDDVTGFAADVWEPAPLPDHLARVVRETHIRIDVGA